MKYNLYPLDKLIGNDCEEENEEVEIIISEIKETAFSLRTEQEVKLFIQKHQLALVEHKNFDTICEKCDRVLYFMETYFRLFVDNEMTISQIGRDKILAQCEPILAKAKPLITNALNPKLIPILSPLLAPENKKEYAIHDAKYLSCFWKNWSLDFDSNTETLQEQEIIDYLIAHNYNPRAFTNFVIGEMISEIYQDDHPEIQIEFLTTKLLHLKRIPICSAKAFISMYPKPNTVLEIWLENEIKNARKKLKTYNSNQLRLVTQTDTRIETSLSVGQLACLLNTLQKGGILTNTSQSEILQIVSKTMSCKKSDQISYGSLHNKYYNIEDKTKESIKETLLTLAKQM